MSASESLKAPSFTASASLTVALCFAVAVLEGFDIQAIGIAAPKLGPALHLSKDVLGKALSASNIGLVFGAALGGWLADLWGRKTVLIGAVLIFGAFTLGTMMSTSFAMLFAVRLCVGLGFGAALPNIMAIASEVAPKGRGGATASMMFCGMPAGGGTVALISALNHDADWKMLFLIGGIIPLAIAPALLFRLKETRASGHDAAAETAKTAPGWYWLAAIPIYLVLNIVAQYATNETGANGLFLTLGNGVGFNLNLGNLLHVTAPWLALITTAVLVYCAVHKRVLFGEGRGTASVLLWLNFVPTLLILYLILNWLPTMVSEGKGLPGAASWAQVAFNYGSVAGALIFGRIVDRVGIRWPMVIAYAGLIASLVGLSAAGGAAMVVIMAGLVGFTLLGANYAMYGVAALYYPTLMRGRGSGATVAWGRLGAVAAPLVGGFLLAGGSTANSVIFGMAIPAVIAGIAVFALSIFAKPEAA